MSEQGSQHLRIFLSSPGDVGEERTAAIKVIEELCFDPLLRGQVTLEAVAWDRKGASVPLVANVTPQEAINQGLAKPSQCDIVIVIFWSRMGTPLPPEYAKQDGSRYLSGTEWEYEEAVNAAKQNSGKPSVLVYRRTEEPVISLRDPLRGHKIEQWERVEDFFSRFYNPDGSIRQGYHQYEKPVEFSELLELHLKTLIQRQFNLDTGAGEDQRFLTQVRLAAQDWEKNNRSDAFLWPHERLKPIYSIIKRLKPELDEATMAFITPEVDRLNADIAKPTTKHLRRAVIGDRLAAIDDPRPGVGVREDGLPDLSWCDVSAGVVTVKYGVNGLNPTKEQRFEVPRFRMAQYPITYKQYRAFLDAPDGFRDNRWWFGLGNRQLEAGKQAFPVNNRPADNVSWYDAVAFCKWLSARLGAEIRLPYEQEWQLAGSGGNDSNLYPWGEKWNPANANMEESGIGQTMAVGLYPLGAAACGIQDMIGNVWEWCLNADSDPNSAGLEGTFHRVLRGGGWITGKLKTNNLYRGGDTPTRRRNIIGFRVVMAE
ncbi:MAG: SUMF1/EgtB/PvdO family nonheme iron enzyme [Anaerolineae bacterium]